MTAKRTEGDELDRPLWPSGSQCPACGRASIGVIDDPIEEVVDGRIFRTTPMSRNRCEACDEEFFAAGQCDEIARQIDDQARDVFGRLSGDDIHTIRHSLGLTQSQLAERLGVSKGLVGRWERGTVLQSRMADRYLRDLSAHPELADAYGVVAREGRGPYRAHR